jgi:hypothetical protein
MTLIGNAEYPMVRAAVDTSLGPRALKDEVIALDMYAGEAERQVLARDPNALTYDPDSDNGKRVRMAAVYWTAALLVPALPDLTSERFTDYSYTRSARDWAQHARDLVGRATAALNAVLVVEPSKSTAGAMFRLARGCRGR